VRVQLRPEAPGRERGQVQVQVRPLAQGLDLRLTTARIEGPVPVSIDAPWLAHVRTQARQHRRVEGARHEQQRGPGERRPLRL